MPEMTELTEAAIRALAQFRGEDAPVTTCYLDVDGRRWLRHQDVERELDILLRRARQDANGNRSVQTDLRRIEDYVKRGFDRSSTRGLAFFSCSAHDLWRVISLPVPVHSRVVINDLPAVGQLEAVVHDYESIGVLLVDKQRARIFVFELGELSERSEMFDELPREVDVRGEKERGTVDHHTDALLAQHVRRAAAAAWDAYQAHHFAHLVVGAPDELATAVEAALHPYLRERLAGRINLAMSSGLEEVRAEAVRTEIAIERRREAEIVTRLRQAVATGRRGASGLAAVLAALNDRRVERLLVSRGYAAGGWRCASCARLEIVGRACPVCEREMQQLDDVVEEAMEEALGQSCRVEICVDNADLDVMGRIGALLRY
jgi:peptide subunit release factor 1 (eRF1)